MRLFPHLLLKTLRPSAASLSLCISFFAFQYTRLEAQQELSSPQAPTQLHQLASAQQWKEIVQRVEALATRTADDDFYYGSALAHLGRLEQADAALQAGQRLAPHDPRFPVERGGIAFQQKHYARAAQHLRRALKLAPGDTYTNGFLGTVYFLEGNTVAALKYWNRVSKPKIAEVLREPTPRVDPALLDRAFAFAPSSTLTLPQLLDSRQRVSALGIFPQFQLDLRARPDGAFDVAFRNQENNGFGDSKLAALLLFLRDLPFQGVTPEYDNIAHQAINFTSLLRWDAQKRRAYAELSAPFEHSAKYRLAFAVDLRNENWALRNSFTGAAPVLAAFNLRSEHGSFELASHATDRLRWRVGADLSHRDFRGISPAATLPPQLLASGFQLRPSAQIQSTLLRLPEHRFTVDAQASSQTARLWSKPAQSSETLQAGLGWHWLPKAQGDDYAMQQQLSIGRSFGQVPFDELFVLGLERDNNLPMHAHIGTRDGRKGSAPLGRSYFLQTWEADKNLYSNGLAAITFGPLLDIGRIANTPTTVLASPRWLFDAGAQIKLRVFSTTVAFSYGHDLRAGHNAFYVNLLP